MSESGNGTATKNVIDQLVTGDITRDEFIKRAALMGLSAAGIGGVLVGAGKATAADRVAARGLQGGVVNILVAAEGDDKGVKDKIGEIKKRFGIDLKMTALAVGPLIEKTNQSVKASSGTFDVIEVLGFTVSNFVGGGYFEKLNARLADVPAGYDYPKDFTPGALKYVSNYDIAKQQFGGKSVYLIPGLHGGGVILFYRKDLLKAAGLQVPKTWGQYLAAAKKLNTGGVAGNSMIAKSGDVSMFLVDFYSRFAGTGGKLMSGSPQAKNFKPRLTSPQAVAALQNMVDCVEHASSGVLQYDFTASTDAFSAGKTAMMAMWSTIAGPVFNPKTSKVASKAGVATTPGTGAAAGRIVRGGWGVGIPKNAKNKDGAWAVITYLTSKEWEKYQTGTYQTDPNRNSTFFNPALNKKLPYLSVAGKAFQKAQILEIANVPETFEMIGAAAEEFAAALGGSSSAAAACKKANDRWTEILKRGGHLA
ncbi:MAG: ABC transporter substrate-binding protein [Gaiella sp.]